MVELNAALNAAEARATQAERKVRNEMDLAAVIRRRCENMDLHLRWRNLFCVRVALWGTHVSNVADIAVWNA